MGDDDDDVGDDDDNDDVDDDDDDDDDDNTLFPPLLSLLFCFNICGGAICVNGAGEAVLANRSRSRRPQPRDHDQEPVASPNSISVYYKNQRYDEALVNENKTVAFPSIAMYESSCNDIVYIKSQLLELRRLINACLLLTLLLLLMIND
ncbi:unnamed protein product [Onchocerca ochengi]|uniref:Uncharacterized protein n=1 Tax=Onchocerca ochengi TaxID=42157 RepID=A0A182E1E3_ONCOC|nr:unnamed protein product [Onchocerca ochengi]